MILSSLIIVYRSTLEYMYPLYLLERKENLTISQEREKRLRENTGLIQIDKQILSLKSLLFVTRQIIVKLQCGKNYFVVSKQIVPKQEKNKKGARLYIMSIDILTKLWLLIGLIAEPAKMMQVIKKIIISQLATRQYIMLAVMTYSIYH